MPKAAPIKHPKGGNDIGHLIFCPACKCGHAFYNAKSFSGSKWTFNGNCEKPTFSPSMLVRKFADPQDCNKVTHICHSFVREGRIQFLNDCTHALAGQTVDLPDVWD